MLSLRTCVLLLRVYTNLVRKHAGNVANLIRCISGSLWAQVGERLHCSLHRSFIPVRHCSSSERLMSTLGL